MTSTTRQPKVLKTHETTSQKAGMVNMSLILTPYRTMQPPKTRTKANTSHSTLTHWTSNLLYACTPKTEPDLQDGETASLRRSKASTQG